MYNGEVNVAEDSFFRCSKCDEEIEIKYWQGLQIIFEDFADYKMEQDAIFENVKHEMVSEKLDNDDGQSNKELHDLEVNDNEDVNDAISNTGRKQRSDGKKSYFAECRICGKKGRRDKIKYHVKSTHSIFASILANNKERPCTWKVWTSGS